MVSARSAPIPGCRLSMTPYPIRKTPIPQDPDLPPEPLPMNRIRLVLATLLALCLGVPWTAVAADDDVKATDAEATVETGADRRERMLLEFEGDGTATLTTVWKRPG